VGHLAPEEELWIPRLAKVKERIWIFLETSGLRIFLANFLVSGNRGDFPEQYFRFPFFFNFLDFFRLIFQIAVTEELIFSAPWEILKVGLPAMA
jgi:hypothetical protein